MKGKIQYILMGLFVLVLSLTFVAAVLWLGAGSTGRDYQEYLVYMQESVSGLRRDNTVKYQGVDVGRVREIGFDPSRVGQVRLLLQVEQGTPIREDTVATLEFQGVTGLAFVNLTGGSAQSPLLRSDPGGALPEIASRPSVWGRLDRTVEDLVEELTEVTGLLKHLLREQNQQSLSNTLRQVEKLTTALAGRSDAMVAMIDDLAATASNTRKASSDLPDLLDRFRDGAGEMKRMAVEVRTTGVVFRDIVEARDQDLQKFVAATLPETGAILDELRHAAANLRRFSEQIDRDPAVLLRGRPPRPGGPGE